MTNKITLDQNHSTTRMLTTEKPVVTSCHEDKFETILFLPENKERQGKGGLRARGYFKKSYEGKPLVSIITIVYNGEKFLEQTIQSVIAQTYDNVEYIIIDGGSIDRTVDIIKKYEEQIDYWVSEKDKGISDAFNKGISLASGKYLNFLNAADTYRNQNILESIKKYFIKSNKIVTGFSQFGNSTIPHTELKNSDKLYTKSLISHQASFIPRVLFQKYGGYATEYKLRMDYEWWMRVLKKNDFLFINSILIDYAEGGVSGNDIICFNKEELYADFKHLSIIIFFFKSLTMIKIILRYFKSIVYKV